MARHGCARFPGAAAAFMGLALLGCNTFQDKEPPPKPFAGTRWEAILELPLAGEQPWIRMGDGRLEGFGGCNRFNARYLQDTVGARAIAFGQISLSRRSCDSGSQAAESRVLEVLAGTSSYQVSGDLMAMSGSAGTLRFRAVSDVVGGGADIANTQWVAAGVEGWASGNAPRLDFSGDGRVTGYTGCNSLNGRFTLSGDRLEISAASTKRACAGKPGDYESQFLKLLSGSPRVLIVGPRMTLTDSTGGKLEFNAGRSPGR